MWKTIYDKKKNKSLVLTVDSILISFIFTIGQTDFSTARKNVDRKQTSPNKVV